MKQILLIAILAFAAWTGYRYFNAPTQTSGPASTVRMAPAAVAPATLAPDTPEERYECDGRQYCSQMTSRAEAEYFVQHCPDTRMDGDGDGEPCENDSRF